jgi:predicted phosphodiesterase
MAAETADFEEEMLMSRVRRFRRIVWCAALALATGAGGQARGEVRSIEAAPGPLVFVTIADLHVTDQASMAGFQQAIQAINTAIRPAFVYIAGDTPDGGTADQYRAYKAVRDTIKVPVCDVAGDHEAKGDGMKNYRKTLGDPNYVFESGGYLFLGLNSMGMDEAQLDWAKKELDPAKDKKQTPIVLIHHNLAGLKDRAVVSQLDKLFTDSGVKLVLTGHTHTNTVINSGHRLDISTTSIKAPRGRDPAGYAIVTLDQAGVAWHFVPLGQQPIVAIANPVGKLMATGPEAVVKGKVALRVKAYDARGIRTVTASVAGAQSIELKQDSSGTWTAETDSTLLGDGEQPVKVTANTTDGRSASEEIVMLVNQAGSFTAAPLTVTDGGAPGGKGGEPKGPKGGKPNKEPVTLEQVPDAVRQAIRKQASGNEITKLEKEVKDEKTSFKAEWTLTDRKQELRLGADGGILESRQEIGAADLPELVAAAAQKIIGDLKNAECKKITQMIDGKAQDRFEVRADVQGENRHLVIGSDGSVEVKGPKGPKKEGPPRPRK